MQVLFFFFSCSPKQKYIASLLGIVSFRCMHHSAVMVIQIGGNGVENKKISRKYRQKIQSPFTRER